MAVDCHPRIVAASHHVREHAVANVPAGVVIPGSCRTYWDMVSETEQAS